MIVLSLVFGSKAQDVKGIITAKVLGNCQIIVGNPNQPVHFDPNDRNHREVKHVQINSNGAWKLRVVPQDGYLISERGDKIDVFRIGYSIRNVIGEGSLSSPEPEYKLYVDPVNPAFGQGCVEFDVKFSLDTEGFEHVKWGTYNTKVDFICTSCDYE